MAQAVHQRPRAATRAALLRAALALLEGTYFSDTADLADETARDHVLDYARAQGWRVAGVVRQELGVLTMALGGDAGRPWLAAPLGVILSGLASGLFHPSTG